MRLVPIRAAMSACLGVWPSKRRGAVSLVMLVLLANSGVFAQPRPGEKSPGKLAPENREPDKKSTAVPAPGGPVATESGGKSAVEVLSAMEDVLAGAIEQAEVSVVALSRVRRGVEEPRAEGQGQIPLLPRRVDGLEPALKPGFVPNEFATGVVVDAKGLILTCHHVLRDDSDYFVHTSDRKQYKARVKAADPRSDMAVLQIDAQGLTPIRFGDASKARKGQFVISLGNPHAIARDGRACASLGIISNLSRWSAPLGPDRGKDSRPTLHHFGTLIHTDARLNLGASGGALLNLKGEMIGLTTSQAAIVGYEQGAGYAIPVNVTFHRVLDTLKQGREVEFGLLGVLPDDLDYLDRVRKNRTGARVDSVNRGTPAWGALRPGDVVTHIDGEAVHDCDALMLGVGGRAAGAAVRLNVERPLAGGEWKSLKVELELAKFPVRGKKYYEVGPATWRGMAVDYASIALDHGVLGGVQGIVPEESSVVVVRVEDGSAAHKAGLRQGMFVTRVGTASVKSPRDFHKLVAEHRGAVKLQQVNLDQFPTAVIDRIVEAVR